MKYLGKRSVASILKMILTVIWWLGIIAIAGFSIGMIVVICIGGPPEGMESPRFTLETSFIQVEFTNATIKDPQLLFMAFFPFGAAMIGLGMAIIYQLRKIFATLADGNPFLLANAKRMRTIGVLIFGGVLFQLIAGIFIGRLIIEKVIVTGVAFNVKGDLNMGGVFFGLVMLILAEIFRQGALLKEEQDLTV